jgi:hypothetical protein
MSKSQLKKELQKLNKEQLIEQIGELYDAYKPIREYYATFLNPDNIQEVFEKYRNIIINEFYPIPKLWEAKTRFSVAKKAIADFSTLKPPSELLADLMITLVENASQFTHDYGDMPEQYYDSTISNFERALKYLYKEDLLNNFKLRCEKCLEYADPCGYGFPDEMADVFYKYYE